MIRLIHRVAVATISTLSLAAPAFAHMSFETAQSAPGARFEGVLALPHGCDGAPTDTVRVTIPEGFSDVEAVAKDGWALETGDAIIWSGGSVPDDAEEQFAFSGTFDADLTAPSVIFAVEQVCGDAVLDWAPEVSLVEGAALIMAGDLELSGAFARATLPNAPVGGGFLTITNTGDEADRLIAAQSPFSPDVQIHEMAVVNDIMEMRALENGIEIAAGESVTLSPGGLHLMFMGIEQPFVEGETVPVTLTFERAGDVEIDLSVQSFGASALEDHSGHDMSGHEGH